MLSQPPSAPQSPRPFGVGIDTSRYGHFAAFLRDDLQPAADDLLFVESADGYARLRQRFDQIVRKHGVCHFVVRLDAAGQYADNLRHFLQQLADSAGASPGCPAFTLSLSCGDPQRNKNYRAALFGTKKSDAIEARAAARFALTERPTADIPMSLELRALRQVAGRLQAVVRQRTRLINQLHHLVALAFPELALVVKDLAAGWVLELLHRFPSATRLAEASENAVAEIAYLPEAQITPLLQHARSSVASLRGAIVEELVRDQVRQLRDVNARQKRLEKLLVSAYQMLPQQNHLATIPGIGEVTAAVLTAFILNIERFESPGKLVAYFGILPIEVSSGVDRDGQPRGPKRFVMSRRGNDLVRRYLWMAALSAIRFNPAVRALYARVVAKHPNHKAIAVGHAMRKLMHLVWAIWKTGRPFVADYYPWDVPSHVGVADNGMSPQKQSAGHKQTAEPARKVVTADCPDIVADAEPIGEGTAIDFAHIKQQLPLVRVLDHLGLLSRLRGTGAQRRGTCPIHRADARGKTFSVNLDEQVFQCFAKDCGAKGDVIDLWSHVNGMSLREAAVDLVQTFHLEPVAKRGTEKRNG